MKAKDVIKRARYTLNDDPDGSFLTSRRHDDSELLAYTIDGVRETAILRPDLFVAEVTMTCQANNVLQDASGAGALYVLDVIGVRGGTALPGGEAPYVSGVMKADFDTLRRTRLNWMADEADTCENWFAYPTDQTKRPQSRFYIYPKAPANQVLGIQIVKDPWHGVADPTTDSDIPLPSELQAVLFEYVVFRAESKNDESVLSQRALASWNRFVDVLGRSELKRKLVQQEGRPQ